MKTILCYGDSNTWGYDASTYDPATGIAKRMPYDMRWTGRIQNMLGPEYHIMVDALNGRTCMREDPYFPHRHGYNSLIESLDKNAPLDLVVLQMGCNELKQVYNLTAGMIAYGFERLVTAVKQPFYGYSEPKVLVIAPSPVGKNIERAELGFVFGPEAYPKSLQLGALYEDIAKRNGCGFIDCAKLDFSLNDIDCLHYSREDHKKLADAAAPKIREMLE